MMNPLLIVLAVALALAVLLLTACWTRTRGLTERLAHVQAEHEAALARLAEELERERAIAVAATAKAEQRIEEKTQAEIRLEEARGRLGVLECEAREALRVRDDALERLRVAESQAALRQQEVVEIKKRMDDWEATKAESLQAAKAAVLATASELSSKLLEDHKRESGEAKKDAEERVRKTTEMLLSQVQELTKTVAALNMQVDQNRGTMDTVWKALSCPGGVGHFAEIGLENTLKSFGLEKGRDFVIQYAVEGKGLRPDAVVFLPGSTVLVIDSKASKFLLELAEAEGAADEEESYRNFGRTMNQHLKSMADKNYKAEILTAYREAGRCGDIKRIMTVMYLPNEGAVDKLLRADGEFVRKATRLEMTIAGPSALTCLIGFARIEIDLAKQGENHERIIQGTQALLDSIGIVIEHTQRVGKGLKSATEGYVKLTSSINSRLLPRVQGLLAHGVRPQRHREIPKNLPSFQMIQLESGEWIEAEAEDIVKDDIVKLAPVR
jgi:DNA recombination protein RmuC